MRREKPPGRGPGTTDIRVVGDNLVHDHPVPPGTDRSRHFVPGYSHESLRDNKSPGDNLRDKKANRVKLTLVE